MNRSKEYPGFWHAVLLCVVFVTLQVCFILPFGILDAVFKLHLVSHPAVLGAVNLSACATVMFMGWLIGKPAMPEVFALHRVSALAIAGVIVASGGAVILLSEVDNLVRFALPPPKPIVHIMRELSAPSQHHFWALVFLMVIVAPVTEELMFRGLILRGFLRRFSIVGAFLLSAMLFGTIHLNPWQFISAFGLGVMFAWWYARTQSLIPSLIGHALANATVVGHQSLPFRVRGFNEGEPFASTDLQPFWFDALGVLLLVAGLWLFRLSTPPIKACVGQSAEQPPPLVPPVPEVPPIIPPDGAASPPVCS